MTYQPHKIVKGMRTRYDNEVRPLIDEGRYELAAIAMASVNLIPSFLRCEVKIIGAHAGLSFLAGGKALQQSLERGDPQDRVEFFRLSFEGAAAQTSMPGGPLDDI